MKKESFVEGHNHTRCPTKFKFQFFLLQKKKKEEANQLGRDQLLIQVENGPSRLLQAFLFPCQIRAGGVCSFFHAKTACSLL